METLTVRFEPTNTSSQTELLRALARLFDGLKEQGVISRANVEPVFPDDDTSKYRGTFTVSFVGPTAPVKAAVTKLSGVRNAYISPNRSTSRA